MTWKGLALASVRQCVTVNLCFETAEARALGLEGHVCEVQIVPRAFADLVVSFLRVFPHLHFISIFLT